MRKFLLLFVLLSTVIYGGNAQNQRLHPTLDNTQSNVTLIETKTKIKGAQNDELPVRKCFTVENEAQRRANDSKLPSIAQFESWISAKIEAQKNSDNAQRATYNIPYIVHVIHNGEAIGTGDNISNTQVYAQIQQINDDFQRMNADAGNTPGAFTGVAGSIDIEFIPALVDENGDTLATVGINRINRNTQGWTAPPYGTCDMQGFGSEYIENTIKPNSQWDPTLYFNIWTMDITCGILGYAQFPAGSGLNGLPGGGTSNTDGCVLLASSVGSIANPGNGAPFNLGRTATHEVGHWLGLRHIWGDGTCATDYCDDTPTQNGPNQSICPAFPSVTCGNGPNGDMFMNYMDYSTDACMNIFTMDQVDRFVAVLTNSPRRVELLSSTVGGTAPVIDTCDAGTLAIDDSTAVCPGETILVATNGDQIIPAAGGYGWNFTPGADGTGGNGTGFSLTGSNPTGNNWNAGLGGILAANSLPDLAGTWFINGFVYADATAIGASLCEFTPTTLTVNWLGAGLPGCIPPDPCEAGTLLNTDSTEACPFDSVRIATNGDEVLPTDGELLWRFIAGVGGTGGNSTGEGTGFTITGLGSDYYVDAGVNGILAANLLPDMAGSWFIQAFIEDSSGNVCSNSTDLRVVDWLDAADAACALPAPPNDLCGDAIAIACDGSVMGTTLGASGDASLGECGGLDYDETSPGVWYVFAGTGDSVTLSTCGTADFDTEIGIYTGPCNNLTCFDGNDDDDAGICSANTSEITFLSVQGTNYNIYITGYDASEVGTFTLSVTCIEIEDTCEAPADLAINNITSNAADLSWTGGGASFDVELVDVTASNSPTGSPTETDVSNPHTFGSLTPENDYDAYVRTSSCDGSDLILTAVFDGPLTGGTPKGIEVYAKNDIADLSVYGFGSANNGGGSDGEEFTFSGSATAGQFLYVANEAVQFMNWFGFAPDFTNGAASVNGDDAIELFKDGEVVDVFGDIAGSNTAWTYQDGWAYRNNTTGPDESTFVLANWSFSGANALDGETDNGTATSSIPVGTYSNAGRIPSAWVGPISFTTLAAACDEPTSLASIPTAPDEAIAAWFAGGSETSWNVELVDVTNGGSFTGTPTDSVTGSPVITFAGLTPETTYEFYVQAVCGSDTSNWVGPNTFVTPPLAPVAEFNAMLTTLCLTDTVQFTDESTNSPNSWAWDFGDGNTDSIQNPVHVYAASGMYTVELIVENVTGIDTMTKVDYIEVQDPPTGFGATASSTTIDEGMSTDLMMTGTFGGAYAWFDEGNNQISTSPTFTVSPTTTTTYTATCNNGVCTVSGTVTITVNPVGPVTPSNDTCSGAIVLNCDDTGIAGTTIGATDMDKPTGGCFSLSEGVWYTIVGTGGEITVDITTDADFDAEIDLSSGSCGSLTPIACIDDELEDATESVVIASVLGTEYFLYISDYSSSSTNNNEGTFTIDVSCLAPPTCGAPNALIVENITDSTADLSWTPTGDETTWHLEIVEAGASTGTPTVSSLTDTFYTATGLTEGTDYEFYVIADCGADSSDWAGPEAFTTTEPVIPAPANDTCGGAITVSCGTNIDIDVSSATNADAPSGCSTSGEGVWYTFVGDDQEWEIVAAPQTADIEIQVYTGSCGALVCESEVDNSFLTETLTITTTSGTTYYMYIGGYSGTQTIDDSINLSITCTPIAAAPANDTCGGAIVLNCDDTGIAGTTIGATDTDKPTGGCFSLSEGVWYTIVGTGGEITVDITTDADFDAEIDLSSGSCGSLTHIDCIDDELEDATESVVIASVLGTEYFLYISDYSSSTTNDNEGTFTIDVSCLAPPMCGAPTALAVENITDSTADLSWTPTGDETTWHLEIVEAGASTGTPTVSSLTDTFYTATGLTEGTDYEFYVIADCGADSSDWAGPEAFTTTEPVQPTPANDTCSGAMTVACDADMDIDLSTATDVDAPSGCSTSGEGLWFTFEGDDQAWEIVAAPQTADIEIQLYSGDCDNLTCVDEVDNFFLTETLTVETVSGTTYYMYIGGYSAGIAVADSFNLSITCSTITNACAAGTLDPSVVDSFLVCPDSTATLLLSGGDTIPTGGGYGVYFVPGADGTGGIDDTLLLTGTTLPFEFDADLNGVLSFNSLPEFLGTWYVFGAVYADPANAFASICDITEDYMVVNFLASGAGACAPPPPAPANDTCGGAITVSCGTNIDIDVSSATNADAPSGCSTSGEGVWYTFVGDDQEWEIVAAPQTADIEIQVYTGSCGALVCESEVDNSFLTETLTITTTSGTTYYMYIGGYSGTQTIDDSINLSITCTPIAAAPANDTCGGAIVLNCDDTGIAGTTIGATDTDKPTGGCFSLSEGVWYTIVGTGGEITVDITTDADFDAEIDLSSGSCGSLTHIDCIDDELEDATESVVIASVLGTEYFLYISDYSSSTTNDNEGTFTIDVSCLAPPMCGAPTALTVENITDSTADLSWTPTGDETTWHLEIVEAGASTGTPTVSSLTDTFYTATGLTEGTDYEFYVIADCGADSSDWAGPEAFTTTEPVQPTPANDTCGGAMTVACDADMDIDLSTATDVDAPSGCSTSGEGLWFTFEGDNQAWEIVAAPQTADIEIQLYSGDCDNLTCVDEVDNFFLTETLTVETVSGTTYYMYIGGYTAGEAVADSFNLSITCSTITNACAAGTLDPSVVDSFLVCPDSTVTLFLSGGDTIPTGGGYGLYFVPGADGTGGIDDTLLLTGTTLPFEFDADLNGVLSFNGLPEFLGTWYVFGAVYADPANAFASICDITEDYMVVNFLAAGVGPCAPPPAAPANDTCGGAVTLNCDDTGIAGTTIGATADDFPGGCFSLSEGVWYTIVGTGDIITVDISTDADFDAEINLSSGTCDSLTHIDCIDDELEDATESVVIVSAVGVEYFLYVSDYSSSTTNDNAGTFTIDVTCETPAVAPANDECADAITTPLVDGYGNCTGQTGTTIGATQSEGAPSCSSSWYDDDVWYEFTTNATIPTSGVVVSVEFFNVNGAGIAVYEGCDTALTDIICSSSPSAGNDSVILDPTDLTANTTYLVRVWAPFTGPATQDSFEICVYEDNTIPPPVPANDTCGGAVVITCPDGFSGTVDASAATLDDAPTCGSSTTGPGVWYTYEGDGNLLDILVDPYNFDSEIQIHSGSCGDLTCELGADNGSVVGATDSILGFATVPGTTYYIYVGTWASFDTDIDSFDLEITCTPPPACNAPTALTVENITETTADLSWTPGGEEAIWNLEVVDITNGGTFTGTPTESGLTDTFFTVTNLVSGNDYEFYVQADCGFDTSAWTGPEEFTALVPAPDNDLCGDAIELNCGDTDIAGTTIGATAADVPGACFSLSEGVWYTIAGTGEVITLDVTADGWDHEIAVYSGTCGALDNIACADNTGGPLESITFPSEVGTDYYLYIGDYSSLTTNDRAGDFTINVSCVTPPENDVCSGAITVACDDVVYGNTTFATAEGGIPSCGTNINLPNGVWYVFEGNGDDVLFSLCDDTTDFDTRLAIFEGPCGALSCIDNSDDDCGLQTELEVSTLSGTDYYVYVMGFDDDEFGNFGLSVTCTTPACDTAQTTAVITDAVCGNDGAIDLSVSAGSGSFSFLWSNGETTEDISGLAAGDYTVDITDDIDGCPATSTFTVGGNDPLEETATATIIGLPCDGSAGTASIDVTIGGGMAPYTYLWDNAATTEDLTGLAAGSYTLTVTDANNCTYTTQPFEIAPAGTSSIFEVSAAVVTDVDCFGNATGAIDISVSGGTAPYTYRWSNDLHVEDIDGLEAGEYVFFVVDATGCEYESAIIVVEQPEAIDEASAGVVTDATCNGEASGSVDITIEGGTAPYTYEWTNGSTDEDPTDLTAGSHQATVTDANGCEFLTQIYVIGEPSVIAQTNASITDADCNGASTGAIDINVSGGTSPYTFIWSDGSTDEDLAGAAAGDYNVVITDAAGCTVISETFTIGEPTAIEISAAVVTDADCNGGATGAIDISVIGGTPPYSYLWSNGETTQDLTDLVAGDYTGVITDANGCELTSPVVTVGEPTVIGVTAAVIEDVDCNGNETGSIDITVDGGTAPYTFVWSNGATTEDLTDLAAGDYTGVITDANGCEFTSPALTVAEPNAIEITSVNVTDVLCNGEANGEIDIEVDGGTAPYTYLWSNGETTQDLTDLEAGDYTGTITDANGCELTAIVTVEEPAAIFEALPPAVTGISCNGETNGAIDITIQGGTLPYDVVWSNGATTEDLTDLGAGDYSYTVTDFNGCTFSTGVSITITEPDALTESAVVSDVACFGGLTGAIDLTVEGGTAPYSYVWSNGATSEDLSGVGAGDYSVTITDANGCELASATYTVGEPTSELTAEVETIDESGNGIGDGSATVSASGGDGPYTYDWANGFGTAATIDNLSSGIYCVDVTDANGCTITVCGTVGTPTAIEDIFQVSEIDLYPNPTRDVANLQVSFTKTIDVELAIVDVLGRVITNEFIPSTDEVSKVIDMANYAAGTYFIRITADKEVITLPLVVQH